MEPADWKKTLQRGFLPDAMEVEWLGEKQRAELRADWLAVWDQIACNEPFHTDCRTRLERSIPLAVGPSRSRRLSHTPSDLVLVADPLEPDIVFVSLSYAMPSALWLRATAESLREVLEPYRHDDAPAIAEFPRVTRIVKTLSIDDRAVIEQHVEHLELWMDDVFWCSGHDDDPWRGVEAPRNVLQQAAWLRDAAREHPGRLPSISWRTLWSKSVMRVEQHPWGIWVFELRYFPARDSRVIAYVNDIIGAHLPDDLPVDLAASLLAGGTVDEIHIDDMKKRGESIVDRLAFTCALAPGETTSFQALAEAAREHANDPAVLEGVADLAADYRFDALLYQLAATHTGSPFGDRMKSFLVPAQEESR